MTPDEIHRHLRRLGACEAGIAHRMLGGENARVLLRLRDHLREQLEALPWDDTPGGLADTVRAVLSGEE